MKAKDEVYKPKHTVRVVTATSLFDGHDASINIMRRIIQGTGAEVIHLGHNRSVEEIVDAAIEEDAQGIAVSSYQGGHIEYFKYMVDLLKKRGASHIQVFGGGGGCIVPDEIKELEAYGVARIYSPEDGATLGLQGIINDLVSRSDFSTVDKIGEVTMEQLTPDNKPLLARLITAVELAKAKEDGHLAALRAQIKKRLEGRRVPVVGITGTGGAGKSSVIDEIVLRLLHDFKDLRIAILTVDPSRRKTGGAL
ncbi:MAG TPA: cobalamin-dependent protein, partial [Syntrophobacteria bacterium]|nr:cobalamin-dependent protein [Syntrophobacteria bacterium]